MPSSSSSTANTPLAYSSSEDTLSDLAAAELQPGHTVEFGVSRISSVRVQDMKQLRYFGNGVGRVLGRKRFPSPRAIEDLPGLPAAVMCSHCYVAFPQFEVAEDDEDEGALQCAAHMSSGHDLVEEFIGYGVWPLVHGWVLGEDIATVVSAVMEKDRQDAVRKCRAVTRVGDPFREAKKAWGGAKSAAPGSSKPPPATKPAAPEPSNSSAGAGAAAAAADKLPSAEPAKERRPLSPVHTVTAAARVADFDTDIWSDAGQLAVVPTPVVATSPTAAVGAKGASQDPWSNFCASGKISLAAATKDVAGFVSQQLRHASQQLKHAAAFADHVASGALTSEFAAEIECLQAQHTDAIREKSAAENKSRRLTERLAAVEAEKGDLQRQLAEERRDENKAIADAQAAQAEAKLARAEASLARQRAEELEKRLSALRNRVDKTEASTRAEVERTHV
eukprot:XP_008660980.1 uncharacterized protein LOC103640113 [Zea mays]